MSIFNYKCKSCKYISTIFSNENIICEKCKSKNLIKMRSIPLKVKSTERLDSYHNVQAIPGIKEDIKKRNKRHMNSELKETIDEHGKTIAKEQGWIKKNGKLRTDIDEK